jgi:hypothetical protein
MSYLFLFILILQILDVKTIDEVSPDELKRQVVKMSDITRRIKQEDKNERIDTQDISPSVAVPALSRLALNRSTDKNRAERARQALILVKGVEKYLNEQISYLSKNQSPSTRYQRQEAFDLLALIHSNEAICVIASYLNDDTIPLFHDSDEIPFPNRMAAAEALRSMGLPDTPGIKGVANIDEYIARWRTWWMKNKSKYQADVESTPAHAIP